MMTARILAATALALAPIPAMADDRAELSAAVSADVAAAPADVWAVIGDFQDLGWHPAVFSTDGEGGQRSRRDAAADADGGRRADRCRGIDRL